MKNYKDQIRKSKPSLENHKIQELIINKTIKRYLKLAATSGAITSLPGALPGIGTAIAVTGGSIADISACMKIHIDMTMCLAIAINNKMSNEDAKHMSYMIALLGSLEQAGSTGATKVASKAGVKMVQTYLKAPVLQIIKELFKKIGITFTQKAAAKVIPFGIGVVIGGDSNYVLTKYVGNTAKETFLLSIEDNKSEN